METGSVQTEIRNFLSKYVKKGFQDNQNLFKTGLLNSLFAMQMVLFVEKKFSLKVENSDLKVENFNSVNAISSFVLSKAA